MATTVYMGLSLPTPSVTPGPGWSSQLNSALTVLDAHDHTSGSGKPIRAAALTIDADVSWNGYNLTTARSLRLQNLAAVPALGTDLSCLTSSGGNLYWINAAGQQVQITSGAGLNATSLGGWGGDFATSGASAFYTSATKTFTLWQSSTQSASLDIGNAILREPGVASAKGITLKSPSALAADYSLTLLASLPGSTLPLLMSSGGIMSTGQITNAQQNFGAPSVSTDVSTKDYVDNTAGTALATASALMRRDASGRVAVATPSASGDAATKGYVDTVPTESFGSVTMGTNWSAASTRSWLRKSANGMCSLLVGGLSRSSGSATTAFTLPSGYRPSITSALQVVALNATGAAISIFQFNTDGTVQSISTITNGDQHYVYLNYPTA